MIQLGHIFRKDVRHLWPELALYSVVLIVYSWAEPLTWQTGAGPHSSIAGWANVLLSLLRPLFPLLWLAIISRLVHDESLVGDRQFWITKPYDRFSLASAKILFVVVCIILPFALMEMYLIVHAGLGALPAVPGMLRNLLSLSLVCWLPFMALASVTSSLSKMLLAAISAFVGFFLFTLVVTLNLLSTHATPPFVDTAVSALFGVVLISTFLFQYVTRLTTASRVALIAVFVCIGVLHSVAPSDILFKLRYPNKPKRLRYDPTNGKGAATTAQLKGAYGNYVLTIPVQRESMPDRNDERSALYNEVASSYRIDGPSIHYESGWQRAGFNGNYVSMYITPNLVEKLGGRPVDMHIDVVGRRLQAINASSFGGLNGFGVPGNGHCLLNLSGNHSMLICRYPFMSPPRTVLRDESDSSISSVDANTAYVVHASAASPCFDPIAEALITMGAEPQTPKHFSVIAYQPVENTRVVIEARRMNIAQYLSSGHQ